MAKVDYIKPIEALHGKLQKKDKVGFAKRQVEGTKYTFTHEKRKKIALTDAQKAQNHKFGMVCQLVAARMRNASTRAADLAGFKAQHKYLTLYSYLWHLIWNDYDNLVADGEIVEEITEEATEE